MHKVLFQVVLWRSEDVGPCDDIGTRSVDVEIRRGPGCVSSA